MDSPKPSGWLRVGLAPGPDDGGIDGTDTNPASRAAERRTV